MTPIYAQQLAQTVLSKGIYKFVWQHVHNLMLLETHSLGRLAPSAKSNAQAALFPIFSKIDNVSLNALMGLTDKISNAFLTVQLQPGPIPMLIMSALILVPILPALRATPTTKQEVAY